MEPLKRHVGRVQGLDGVIDHVPVDILFRSGSGVMSISEELVAEFEGKVSGCAQVKTSFEGRVRVWTAFAKERTITTHTVRFNLRLDTDLGKVRSMLSYVVIPGERNPIILGERRFRQVLSKVVVHYLGGTVLALSWDDAGSGLSCGYPVLNVVSTGDGLGDKRLDDHVLSAGEGMATRRAVQLAVRALEVWEGNNCCITQKQRNEDAGSSWWKRWKLQCNGWKKCF